MRRLVDAYRQHFPALILGFAFSEESRHYRHAWVEVVPGETTDSYAVVPGARTGNLLQNYALEENGAAVGAGTVVQMRHRDEQGQLHYAFVAPASSRTIILGPPPGDSGGSGGGGGGGPGGGPGDDLCVTITGADGCECFSVRETLTAAGEGLWTGSFDAGCGQPVQVRVQDGDVSLEWLGTDVTEGPFTLSGIPGEVEAELSGGGCAGKVTISVSEGACDPNGGPGGDCDQIIGGKQCYDCDHEFQFCNVIPTPIVTAVCPVFSDLVGGDGILVERTAEGEITITATGGAGGGRVPVLTGLVAQRQVLQLPAGFVLTDPECHVNPADCCPGSGTDGEGCCYPRPPDTLYASLFDATSGCACLPACVTLVYDAGEDAWFSTEPIADGCGTGEYYLRLKCYGGTYHLDVVGAEHEDVLLGVSFYGPTCDPFAYAATFSDDEAIVCEHAGHFGYLIAESDCHDGSGSGGGGGGGNLPNGCCPDNDVPVNLVAAFSEGTGDLACFDGLSVPLSGFVAGTQVQWFGTIPAGTCGRSGDTLGMNCAPQGGGFTWAITSSVYGILGNPTSVSCSPFELVFVVPAVLTGSGTVKITVTPA